jgi:hypothetical protein
MGSLAASVRQTSSARNKKRISTYHRQVPRAPRSCNTKHTVSSWLQELEDTELTSHAAVAIARHGLVIVVVHVASCTACSSTTATLAHGLLLLVQQAGQLVCLGPHRHTVTHWAKLPWLGPHTNPDWTPNISRAHKKISKFFPKTHWKLSNFLVFFFFFYRRNIFNGMQLFNKSCNCYYYYTYTYAHYLSIIIITFLLNSCMQLKIFLLFKKITYSWKKLLVEDF